MNPYAATILVGVILIVFGMSRRWAALGMVVGALFLPQDASLQLAGFNLFPTRILGYLCFLRVISRSEFSFSQFTRIDKALFMLHLFTTFILFTRPEESFLLRIAKLLDVLLPYFAFRGLIRTPDDFRWLLKAMVPLLLVFVVVLLGERVMRSNPFRYLGASGRAWLREGTPRCFGSFRHPSLLGSVGACFFPVYVALMWSKVDRVRGIVGCIACMGIVGCSNSGGPLSVVAMGGIGWLLWGMRKKMQLFRRGLVAGVFVLGMIMKAPIWYLLARISGITGGTGWHRAFLIDVSFRNLDKWWLIGMPTSGTRGWFAYNLATTGGADITNQFIAFGLQGGLTAIGLFIFLLYRAFSELGKALAIVRKNPAFVDEEKLLWSLGVLLAAHISNWLGITYFDQFLILWLLHLASLASVSNYWLTRSAADLRANQSTEDDWDRSFGGNRAFGTA